MVALRSCYGRFDIVSLRSRDRWNIAVRSGFYAAMARRLERKKLGVQLDPPALLLLYAESGVNKKRTMPIRYFFNMHFINTVTVTNNCMYIYMNRAKAKTTLKTILSFLRIHTSVAYRIRFVFSIDSEHEAHRIISLKKKETRRMRKIKQLKRIFYIRYSLSLAVAFLALRRKI